MPTDVNDQHWIETYKSLITLSIEGFKFSALINGGAAVALLAYLGNVAAKSDRTLPDMRYAMGAFLFGLASCGISMFFGYLTQLRLLNESSGFDDLRVPHGALLLSGAAFFLLSLIAFGIGAFLAVLRFH